MRNLYDFQHTSNREAARIIAVAYGGNRMEAKMSNLKDQRDSPLLDIRFNEALHRGRALLQVPPSFFRPRCVRRPGGHTFGCVRRRPDLYKAEKERRSFRGQQTPAAFDDLVDRV
jgi:hypothetical protein